MPAPTHHVTVVQQHANLQNPLIGSRRQPRAYFFCAGATPPLFTFYTADETPFLLFRRGSQPHSPSPPRPPFLAWPPPFAQGAVPPSIRHTAVEPHSPCLRTFVWRTITPPLYLPHPPFSAWGTLVTIVILQYNVISAISTRDFKTVLSYPSLER